MAAGAEPDRRSLTAALVERARDAGVGAVLATPVLPSLDLADLCGVPVWLKAENLQRTGSFKLRGAMAKLAALGGAADVGVIAGSAGNHARAVAFAARHRGVPCTIYMPTGASITKAEACVALGAEVRLEWPDVDGAVAAARADATATGRPFVHPYADIDVIAGQATLGSEVLAQVPDVATVLVPLGGGGLASGLAWAIRQHRPDVRVVGIQAAACAPWPSLLHDEPTAHSHPPPDTAVHTLADGIAVRRPDPVTLPFVRSLVDDVVTVDEDAIADAVVWLFENAKLVVEGAGAVGIAALRAGLVPEPAGPIVAVLTGGNIDPGLLGDAIRRYETRSGRRLLLRARLEDRPGALADLCRVLADGGANVVDIQHVREGIELHFGQTGVQIVAQVRGAEHGASVLARAAASGFDVDALRSWPD